MDATAEQILLFQIQQRLLGIEARLNGQDSRIAELELRILHLLGVQDEPPAKTAAHGK